MPILDAIGGAGIETLQAYDNEIVVITSSAALTSSKILSTLAGGGSAKAVLLSNTHASAALAFNVNGITALATHIQLPAGQSVMIRGLTNIQNLRMLSATATTFITYFR